MKQNFRHAAHLAVLCGLGLGAAGAHAASVEIVQDGQLHTGSYLDNYYVGGYAGNSYTSGPIDTSQYGPGPNAGFTFSSNALVESSGTNNGKFENLPTDSLGGNTQILSFSGLGGSSTTDTINFAAGFSSVSFNYSLDGNNSSYNQTVNVWSGVNGTGQLLGTIALTAAGTAVACTSTLDAYCTWSAASGSNFSGVAQSLTFGVANSTPSENLELDAVTVTAVPLPASVWLMASGLVALVGTGLRRKLAA
jgi:hypothetical protein